MRRSLCFGILWFAFLHFVNAQIYRNITIDVGLTNNYVYSIARDGEGFTWMLSSSGADRFDGTDFVHFFLPTDYRPIGVSSQYQLLTDHNGDIWEVGTRRGNSICFLDRKIGEFVLIPINKSGERGLNFLFLDKRNRIWLSNGKRIFIYDIDSRSQEELDGYVASDIVCGAEVSDNRYVIGLDKGLVVVSQSGEEWHVSSVEGEIEWKNYHIHQLSERISQRFVPHTISDISATKMTCLGDTDGTLILFDTKSHFYRVNINTGKADAHVIQPIHDTHITGLKRYFDESDKWFVATEGRGVFLLDSEECTVSQYLCFDYNDNSGLRGNVILDVYAESETGRVWLANYPYGVCCYTPDFPLFNRYVSKADGINSISPGVVTEIMQDSDGDMWYATSSGVSCHLHKSNRWKHYLRDRKRKNLTYLAVCEIAPGKVMASGLMSGGFVIDKHTDEVIAINPQYFGSDSDADYNVRDIYRDHHGIVWLAGNDYLGRIDWKTKTYTAYPLRNPAIMIATKDDDHFWLATLEEVWVVDVHTAEMTQFALPENCVDINDMITTQKGELYVATADEGLFSCDLTAPGDVREFKNFKYENSALISNNIIAMVENSEGNILMSTDQGLTKFYVDKGTFVNWSYSLGMFSFGFYKKSAVHTEENTVHYGTYDGVIAIHDSVCLPRATDSKTIFSNLHINNKPQNPGLDFDHLELGYNQRQIAFKVGNLNYDNPEMYLYSWKLESDDLFRRNGVTKDRNIRILLKHGNYKLTVYTYDVFNNNIVEERVVTISVNVPIWRNPASIVVYIALFMLLIFLLHIFFLYRNKRLMAEDKVNFFIRAAHEIRTPLSLIKAPLEEISEREQLSERGYKNIQTVLRSANDLLLLTGDLLNIERMKMRSTELRLFHTNLAEYMQDLIVPFQMYAKSRKLKLEYVSVADGDVWIDRSRMDSIIQNLVNNAIKYTPSGGMVTVSSNVSDTNWSVVISDTGVGISEEEKNRLTEMFYRSSKVEDNISGAGVGLFLVKKLVQEHGGEMSLESEDGKGTTFTVEFPMEYKEQKNVVMVTAEKQKQKLTSNSPKVLVVEDNSDLRRFLTDALSDSFIIHTAENGEEAYNKVRFVHPDIIISDVMMPVMQGDELCRKIKTDIETSHIPVILLTARADEDSQVEGLASLADEYITKPFSMDVLRARIGNILANRKILQKIFSAVPKGKDDVNEVLETQNVDQTIMDAHSVDVEFIKSVSKMIDEHLSENNLTVDTLCALVGMSRTSLYNKIKSLTGYPPADLIRIRRIAKAKSLLDNTRLTINDISDRCGFSDVKYFRDVFKKNVGVSPSQYRNRNGDGYED